jgi:hypothetical protein
MHPNIDHDVSISVPTPLISGGEKTSYTVNKPN